MGQEVAPVEEAAVGQEVAPVEEAAVLAVEEEVVPAVDQVLDLGQAVAAGLELALVLLQG